MTTKSARKENGLGDFREPSAFEWTDKRSKAVVMLAQGYTQDEAAAEVGVSDRTIRNWKDHPEFSAEMDRLSLMLGIAARAERLRIAMRMVRKKENRSNRDLLDWLKFAQSETDGVKLDLAALAEAASSVAGEGPDGDDDVPAGGDEQENPVADTPAASLGAE